VKKVGLGSGDKQSCSQVHTLKKEGRIRICFASGSKNKAAPDIPGFSRLRSNGKNQPGPAGDLLLPDRARFYWN